MADTATDAFILSDPEGNYYLVPREVIELSKVDPDHVNELEDAMDTDVQGFSLGGAFSFQGVLKLNPTVPTKPGGGTQWPYYLPAPDFSIGEQGMH